MAKYAQLKYGLTRTCCKCKSQLNILHPCNRNTELKNKQTHQKTCIVVYSNYNQTSTFLSRTFPEPAPARSSSPSHSKVSSVKRTVRLCTSPPPIPLPYSHSSLFQRYRTRKHTTQRYVFITPIVSFTHMNVYNLMKNLTGEFSPLDNILLRNRPA